MSWMVKLLTLRELKIFVFTVDGHDQLLLVNALGVIKSTTYP